jgi:hypothetical protein
MFVFSLTENSEPALQRLLTLCVPNPKAILGYSGSSKDSLHYSRLHVALSKHYGNLSTIRVFTIYSKALFISGGNFFHSQPENTPWMDAFMASDYFTQYITSRT